jgi:hypothetical protein
MGTLHVSQVVEGAVPLEEFRLPIAELSSDDYRALSAEMSLQAFLAELVHK